MIYKIYTLNHPITNEIRYVGYTSTALKESESFKEKMRGSNNQFFGKKHSPETLAIISKRIKEALAKKKLLNITSNGL